MWHNIEDIQTLKTSGEVVAARKLLIFKHSPRCHHSQMVDFLLTEAADSLKALADCYRVDVVAQAQLAREVADYFEESHASPQVLVIERGRCIYEAQKLEIELEEILEALREGEVWA